ncbi:hypothetical protein LTR66_010502 [Elasticomyces elasticus]|nr:hypothetical protein LTR66_010502 [Elasticomyces elasticus]
MTSPQAFENRGHGLYPNHFIKFIYPAFDLLEEGEHGPVVRFPRQCRTRYEPTVPIDAAGNKDFSSTYTAFYSVAAVDVSDHAEHLRAHQDVFNQMPSQMHDDSPAGEEATARFLSEQMESVQKIAGLTVLKFRSTVFNNTQPAGEERVTFEIGEAGFRMLPKYQEWVQNVLNLIGQTTDRSTLEVRYRLYAQRPRRTAVPWLAPRVPDIGRALRRTLRPISASRAKVEEAEECFICHENYDGSSAAADETPVMETPVRLPCGHVSGDKCINAWLADKAPEAMSCPMCRGRVYTPAQARDLRLGFEGGVYVFDERYSVWENNERANVDLDGELSDVMPIIADSAILLRGWTDIVSRAYLEPNTRTPFRFQHVRFPETGIADGALRHATRHYHEVGVTPQRLFEALRAAVYFAVLDKFDVDNLPDGLRARALESIVNNDETALPIRDGWMAWIAQQIKRMVNFQVVRRHWGLN